MIELRRKLERWLRHPVLGPLLLLLLALVAAMALLQAAHGGAAGLGVVCLVIFGALGPVVLGRALRLDSSCRVRRPSDRAPPRPPAGAAAVRRPDPGRSLTLPLLH